jgi:hypothetical protein
MDDRFPGKPSVAAVLVFMVKLQFVSIGFNLFHNFPRSVGEGRG